MISISSDQTVESIKSGAVLADVVSSKAPSLVNTNKDFTQKDIAGVRTAFSKAGISLADVDDAQMADIIRTIKLGTTFPTDCDWIGLTLNGKTFRTTKKILNYSKDLSGVKRELNCSSAATKAEDLLANNSLTKVPYSHVSDKVEGSGVKEMLVIGKLASPGTVLLHNPQVTGKLLSNYDAGKEKMTGDELTAGLTSLDPNWLQTPSGEKRLDNLAKANPAALKTLRKSADVSDKDIIMATKAYKPTSFVERLKRFSPSVLL